MTRSALRPGEREESDGEQTDKACADERDHVTEARSQGPDAVERDRRQRSEGRRFIVDIVRDRCEKIARNGVHLGVAGDAGSGHGHALSDSKRAFEPLAQRDHGAGRRVAKRQWLVEARTDGTQRCADLIPADLGQNLLHKIRPWLSLGDKALAGKIDDHPLRAGRDEGSRSPDQKVTGPGRRAGHVGNLSRAAAEALAVCAVERRSAKKAGLLLRGDVGGGTSKVAWNVEGSLTFAISKNWTLGAAYRYMHEDYSNRTGSESRSIGLSFEGPRLLATVTF